MSLEAKIDSLIVALNENTAAMKASGASAAKSPDAPAKGKAAKAPAGPTREEVTAAATAYAKEHGKAAAKALISKHGGKDLASLPEKSWSAFIEATKEAPGEGEEDEDDGL